MNTKPRCSYQLHIQLCDIKPAIWRRLLVADCISLAHLHRSIQAAMGWSNSHAYAFEIAGQRYGIPDPDWPDDPTMDARRYTLGQLLQGQALPMRYTYDFGDDWLHRIKLEAVAPLANAELAQALALSPQCLAGRNACPPEDCGGVPGYLDWLENLQEHAQQPFDPKHFDLSAAQARMAALQVAARPAIRTSPSKAAIQELALA